MVDFEYIQFSVKRACGRRGRFFKEKAPQKPFAKGYGGSHKNYP
jgi:hypothetical protein